METGTARRPLKSRDTAWARGIAPLLLKWHFSPNAISVASVFFSASAGAALYFSAHAAWVQRAILLLAGVAGIQLRLLCNLFDGMVALEGGLKTKSGEVFNDVPDRISDALILVPIGYAVPNLPYGPGLGWCAGLLAVFTAYVRMLGGAAGLKQSFLGPMAKQQRMAVVTAACLMSIFEGRLLPQGSVLWAALVLIILGCIVTIVRRTLRIVRDLEAS